VEIKKVNTEFLKYLYQIYKGTKVSLITDEEALEAALKDKYRQQVKEGKV